MFSTENIKQHAETFKKRSIKYLNPIALKALNKVQFNHYY